MATHDDPPTDLSGGHVLVSPDQFEGILTAPEVARHIAAGLRSARPAVPVVLLPLASGGDGTVEAAISTGWKRIELDVAGPAGRPVRASLAVDDGTALIELAEASGLRRVPDGQSRPLTASSMGTGQLIAEAVRLGMRRIVVGLGGSACTDGGAGIVQALGGRLLDVRGRPLPPGGGALRSLHALDLRGLMDLSAIEIVVASDVHNPLLGRTGTVPAYSALKGAGQEEQRVLEAGLRRWADLTEAACRRPLRDQRGAGAAGGAAFGAMAFLGARLVPGTVFLLELLRFSDKARGARLVITGEGSLDSGTLRGRAPVGIARAGARARVPVVAVADHRSLTGEQLRRARIQGAYALADFERDPERRRRQAGPLLERLTVAIADEWLPMK